MKFLVLGSTGMAGHMISQYLLDSGHSVTKLARRQTMFVADAVMDVTKTKDITSYIRNGGFDYIINCIGILNKHANKDIHTTIWLNSYLPHFLSYITENTETRIIHLSTDCVFSGSKGGYTENSVPDAHDYYGRTKTLGELIDNRNITFRNSIIGPDLETDGAGLFNWFMKQQGCVDGYVKTVWSGVTTLFLAQAIERVALDNVCGLYQLSNNVPISKYDLLKLIGVAFHKKIHINKVDGFDSNKSLIDTQRRFNVPSYSDMLEDLYLYMKKHSRLYPHYILQ